MKFIVFLLFILISLSAVAKTSAEQRAELDYEIAAMVGIDYKLPGGGLSFSKFLDSDNLIGLKAFQGKKGNSDNFFDSPENQTVFAANYKHFFGNSFYLSSGLYYLNYYEEHWNGVDRLTDMGAEVRIGNQWQWDHFSFGFDWIGLGYGFIFFNRTDDSETKLTATSINFYMAYSF